MSQYSKYDSEFCGNIPIHIINTVQTYAVLVVLDRQLVIRQVSENVDTVFGKSARELIDITLRELTGEAFAGQIAGMREYTGGERFTTNWDGHYVIAHFHPELILLEIETAIAAREGATFMDHFRDLRETIRRIDTATDVQSVCTVAADELKKVSGFDKVMIYVFDKDWNGHVMAEAREEEMEAYLGFTFPASDIPKPARDIYKNNPYRFIPNRDFEPVKLYPVINPVTHAFLDMSDCNVRAVAAVHVEYLKNMKVGASMSVRLMINGELWGLIACHHQTARDIDHQLCTTLELLSTIISARINTLQLQGYFDFNTRLNNLYTQVIANIYQNDKLQDGLTAGDGAPILMDMMQATGMAVIMNRQVQLSGTVPSKSEIEDITLWLHLKDGRRVYHTDSLAAEYEISDSLAEMASGLLAIPIQAQQDEYILLFRKELIQTTSWGGNPEERIFFDKDPQIYHPRHSFKLWQEHVKGFSSPWRPEEIQAAENLRSFIFAFLSPTQDNRDL